MNIDVDDLSQIIRLVDGNHSLGAGALAEAILDHLPAPQIIRTVEELEALDPDTLLMPEGFKSPITRQSMDNFGITVSGAHYAVVVASGEHVRSCWTALERNQK